MKDISVKVPIFEGSPGEGPITNVSSYRRDDKDMVVYSTATRIRVIHYEKKQKICMLEIPEKYPSFPSYIYSSKAIKPTLIWRRLRIVGEPQDSDVLIIQWMNMIKLCKVMVN
jgi:hypothetical protein